MGGQTCVCLVSVWFMMRCIISLSCFRRVVLQAVGIFHKKHSDGLDGGLLAFDF